MIPVDSNEPAHHGKADGQNVVGLGVERNLPHPGDPRPSRQNEEADDDCSRAEEG